ncbi:MAG TPA: DnaJ domain-containing protein [Thermodesulfobacteriota bacterium]|nr:DnaJ domain-containing protein [Thermodesulfobacteriota bacterium]
MGVQRALVIGSDQDSCSAVKEFLESKGLITELALDYEEGLERLLYEKPDIAVVGLIHGGPDDSFISGINDSGIYGLADFETGVISKGLKPVLILENQRQTNSLFDFLNLYLKDEGVQPSSEEFRGRGDLQDISYPDLLVHIYRNKHTGVLTVSSGVKLQVFFLDGVPVFAEGGDLETALGRMLLDSGHIQKTEYDMALTSAIRKNQKIGHVLIEMGLVSPHELSSLLELQVKEKVIRGFRYTRGKYVFQTGGDLIQGLVAYPIKLPQILYEGVKRYVESEYIEDFFLLKQGINPQIKIVSDLMEEVSGGGLNPRELRFVQLRKDGTGINDIVEKSILGREETLKLLFFLYLVGYIKVPEVEESRTKKASVEESYERAGATDYGVSKPFVEDVINLDEEIIGIELDTHEESLHLESSGEEEVISSGIEEEKPKQEVIEKTGRGKIRMGRGSESKPSEEAQSDIKDRKRTREEKEALINEILKLYSTLDEKNYYQILGVENDSGKEKIKEAYFSLVKKLHPDANPDLSKDIRHKAEQVFVKIAEAYETLSDGEKRLDYDTQLETSDVRSHLKELYEAELAYKKGKAFLKQRSYDEAEGEFKKAVDLAPNEAAYIGALAWATFLAAADKDKVLNNVKEQLERAISLNPRIAEIYYYLGCIYKQINLKSDAEANFAKALECDPNFLEAKRELWLLQKRKPEKYEDKEKKRKGFWSSLFKK